jgi:hypothetical protein
MRRQPPPGRAAPDAGAQELGAVGWLVIVLAIVLFVTGVAWHGVTVAVIERIWRNLLERPSGPLNFRFILQPVMAVVAAILDGVRDARAGRSPFFATILLQPGERIGRLREGLRATARIILLGLVMDTIWQTLVLHRFYPNEALIVALLFAFVPYVVARGLATRVARIRIAARRAK